MSKQYRKINDLMREAAHILVGHGWRADRFEQLFELSRSSAFRLAKWAREEHSKAIVAEALERARQRQAEEAITAGSLRDGWQKAPEDAGEMRRGVSLGSNVRFRS
jgi:hypothetical protein